MTKKIFKSIMIVAVVVLAASFGIIMGCLYQYFSDMQEKQLAEELTLAAAGVEKNGQAYLEALQLKQYRLTWVAGNGEVLYDTQSDREAMENHGDREEIRQALLSREGKSVRYSATLLEKTIYCAQRLEDGSVLRISVGNATVWVLVLEMIQPILVVFFVALVMSGVLASQLSKHIFDVTEAADAERNRREFTANVSHELKTPLQSIMGSAELLENGLVKEEDMTRFVGHIRTEAGRLVTLVEDIIRLSQLDEESEMPFETVDLYEMAKETAEGLADIAAARRVKISVTGEPICVKGVRQLLAEILFNLCDNAIKYNKEGGTVEVSVTAQRGNAVLLVKDSGIGIPPEHQERVFERFYRVDKSRSKESGGTGLGLSIVKHAVQYLQGKIELQSIPGEGTTVRIFLTQS